VPAYSFHPPPPSRRPTVRGLSGPATFQVRGSQIWPCTSPKMPCVPGNPHLPPDARSPKARHRAGKLFKIIDICLIMSERRDSAQMRTGVACVLVMRRARSSTQSTHTHIHIHTHTHTHTHGEEATEMTTRTEDTVLTTNTRAPHTHRLCTPACKRGSRQRAELVNAYSMWPCRPSDPSGPGDPGLGFRVYGLGFRYARIPM